jgi:3-hydroxy-3-methylglutaryl CoA synthase
VCDIDITVDGKGLTVEIYSDVEDDFRERYTNYLRSMKQRIYDTYLGYNELEDERKMVNQQAMRTPGRRGEIIKSEEIDKEFSRRYIEHKKVMS